MLGPKHSSRGLTFPNVDNTDLPGGSHQVQCPSPSKLLPKSIFKLSLRNLLFGPSCHGLSLYVVDIGESVDHEGDLSFGQQQELSLCLPIFGHLNLSLEVEFVLSTRPLPIGESNVSNYTLVQQYTSPASSQSCNFFDDQPSRQRCHKDRWHASRVDVCTRHLAFAKTLKTLKTENYREPRLHLNLLCTLVSPGVCGVDAPRSVGVLRLCGLTARPLTLLIRMVRPACRFTLSPNGFDSPLSRLTQGYHHCVVSPTRLPTTSLLTRLLRRLFSGVSSQHRLSMTREKQTVLSRLFRRFPKINL